MTTWRHDFPPETLVAAPLMPVTVWRKQVARSQPAPVLSGRVDMHGACLAGQVHYVSRHPGHLTCADRGPAGRKIKLA